MTHHDISSLPRKFRLRVKYTGNIIAREAPIGQNVFSPKFQRIKTTIRLMSLLALFKVFLFDINYEILLLTIQRQKYL